MQRVRRALVVCVVAGLGVGLAWRAARRHDAENEADRISGALAASDRSDKENAPSFFSAAAAPSPVATDSTLEEADLMELLRGSNLDPEWALSLAREGNRRFPNSPLCAERSFREIRALVDLNRIGEAHSLARHFVQTQPDGPYTERVTRLMGVRPHREGPPLGR